LDDVLGLDLLKVFHINVAHSTRKAKKDRHANIGALASVQRALDHYWPLTQYTSSEYAKRASRQFIWKPFQLGLAIMENLKK